MVGANTVKTPGPSQSRPKAKSQHLMMPNEIELIKEDELWANVYTKDCIARIRPTTGKVFGWILGDNLRSQSLGRRAEVFNGIAYDKLGKRLFVTGKLWSKLFEVRLVPVRQAFSEQEIEKMCIPSVNVFHRGKR